MLKHVSTQNFKLSLYDSVGGDTLSLGSSVSSNDSTCTTDSCLDPMDVSFTSSTNSIHSIEPSPASTSHTKVILKIHTRVLCTDAEYKTLPVYEHTTCKEIVHTILAKFRLKHLDPNLFYLCIETWIKQTGIPIRSVMTLEDDTCPGLLLSCYKNKDLKFTLMMRRGSLVKVHDTCLQPEPVCRSVQLWNRTTVSQLIELLVRASDVPPANTGGVLALYEVCPSHNYCRKLNGNEYPLSVQCEWPNQDFNVFQLRRVEDNSLGSSALFNNTFNNFKQNFKNELSYSLSLHKSNTSAIRSPISTSSASSPSSQSSDAFLYI